MTLELALWDVGQGDCTVIRLPDGRLLIIDVGPPDSPILDWLLQRPQERIYAVVLTHNDEDHCGCAIEMIDDLGSRLKGLFLLIDRSAGGKNESLSHIGQFRKCPSYFRKVCSSQGWMDSG